MRLARLCLVILLTTMPRIVYGQTAKPANDPPKVESAAQPETKKANKPRSEAQKKSDERMRACGREWRVAKAANKTNGQTWRQYSLDCRKRKKAGG